MTVISAVGSLRAATRTDLVETETAGGVSGRSTINQILNGGLALAKPLVADFSWVNQGTATAADTDRGVVLTHVNHAGINLRALAKAIPATPYTLNVRLRFNSTLRTYIGYGVGWRKSGTGECRMLHCLHHSGALNGIQRLTLTGSTSTATNSTEFAQTYDQINHLRIADNGTTRTFSLSWDGDNFIDLDTEAHTTYIPDADQIFVYSYLNNAGGYASDAKLLIEHWLVT